MYETLKKGRRKNAKDDLEEGASIFSEHERKALSWIIAFLGMGLDFPYRAKYPDEDVRKSNLPADPWIMGYIGTFVSSSFENVIQNHSEELIEQNENKIQAVTLFCFVQIYGDLGKSYFDQWLAHKESNNNLPFLEGSSAADRQQIQFLENALSERGLEDQENKNMLLEYVVLKYFD